MNVARMCGIYNNFLDEVGIGLDDNEPFVIHNHDSSIVLKVFQWCIYHHDHPVILKSSSGEYYITPFSQFDSNFFRTECSTLLQMLQAAEYLDIPILMEQCINE
ncbi:suppressor of kinetochore protein mutant [Blomia tropicalis]|nr:suppressor of kinetochore protein mutant [Blomia tropicalis]